MGRPGTYSFTGVFTQDSPTSVDDGTGSDPADLLLGYPASGEVENSAQSVDTGRAHPPYANWARITIGLPEENLRAQAALRAVLQQ